MNGRYLVANVTPAQTPAHEPSGGDAPHASSLMHFLSPLAHWMHAPQTMELCVNGPGQLYVETHQGWQHHACQSLSLAWLRALGQCVATFAGLPLDEAHPFLCASLPGGERVQLAWPPAVDAQRPCLSLRRPLGSAPSLMDLARHGWFAPSPQSPPQSRADQRGTHDDALRALLRRHELVRFLRLAVRWRRNIVICGRTGSGKTSLMNALVREIAVHERLIALEDTPELDLRRHPNHVRMLHARDGDGQGRPSAASALTASLRMRPQRILLAELRGAECWQFIRLAASGHPGSLSSIHAGSCELAREQMLLLMRQDPTAQALPGEDLHRLLDLCVDVIVHIDRRGAIVRVQDIELRARDGNGDGEHPSPYARLSALSKQTQDTPMHGRART